MLVHCAFTELTLLAWPGLGKASIVESAALSLRGKRCLTDVMHLNVCCNCCICSWKCVMHLTICCIRTWIFFLYLLLLSTPIRRQLANGLACISLNWLYANAFQYCLQCSWWTWHDQKLYLTSKWVKVNHWWITSQSVIGCFIPCRLRPSLLLSWVAVLWCRLM